MANRSVSLGGAELPNNEVFYAQLRLGDLEAARQALAKICAEAGATVAVPGQPGRFNKAAAPRSQASWQVECASCFGCGRGRPSLRLDIPVRERTERHPKATRSCARHPGQRRLYAERIALRTQWRAPSEEVSKDPEWLAAWNDPKLSETMAAYRKNLTAFRKGG